MSEASGEGGRAKRGTAGGGGERRGGTARVGGRRRRRRDRRVGCMYMVLWMGFSLSGRSSLVVNRGTGGVGLQG